MLEMLGLFLVLILLDHMYAKYRKNPYASWG